MGRWGLALTLGAQEGFSVGRVSGRRDARRALGCTRWGPTCRHVPSTSAGFTEADWQSKVKGL